MSANNLDGFLHRDLAVFSGSKRKFYVSCVFQVEVPVTENASLAFFNQSEAEFRAMLRLLKPGIRMQVAWSMDSDCSDALLHYYERTEAGRLNAFARRERHERFTRYSKAMERGELRFQRVSIYFSRQLTTKGDMTQVLEAESQGFDVLEAEIRGCFERLGGRVKRMKSELFSEMFRYCNPSQVQSGDLTKFYDPSRSLLANVLTGEGNATDSGFFLDAKHVGVIAIRTLPQATCSGIILALTGLPIRDFGITANVALLDTSREIANEEKEITRLQRSLRGGGQQRAVTILEQRMQRVQKLAGNEEVPFEVQIIIRAWDETQHGLQTKLGILKAAVSRMQLAQSYAPTTPVSAKAYFFAGFPGWCWDSCRDFFHPIGDAPLANLLPISGSPALGSAEALYDGANGGVIGINTFLGEEGSESPQAALVCGKSGSGKSCFVIDLLTQTSAAGYSFTAILDNGLSYETYARTIDPNCEPVIIKPGGSVTLNYLDTKGLPLSSEHLVDVVGVAHLMAGRKLEEDADRLRRAVLSRCANDFCREFALDWLRNGDGNRLLKVGRYAVALRKRDSGSGKVSLLETHRRFSEWASGNKAEAEKLLAGISELEVRGTPISAILPLAFAFMSPEETATHTDFQEWLQLEAMGDSPDRDEVAALATLLKPWCADEGIYGAIFDGINNVNFNGEVVHLELGQIPASAPDLRNLTSLIVTNQTRNELIRRPRDQRKRVVIEEVGSFLSIPGGEQVIREVFQTSRKYNTWVCAVAQQIQDLEGSLSSLIGNIRLAFLMKQSSEQEVETLTRIFDLSEAAKEALSRFPEPSREQGAPFLCWKSHGERPEIVTGFHVASPEMLFVSSSSGSHFERRKSALAGYDDLLGGILAEAAR